MAEQERRAGTSRLVYDKTTRTIRPERTPADFSREFAGYMADSADHFLKVWCERPEEWTDQARTEAFRDLQSAVYEWRKREAVAQSNCSSQAIQEKP